jgi:hypothetical protein
MVRRRRALVLMLAAEHRVVVEPATDAGDRVRLVPSSD